tara:strand:+ start:1705 stop:2967 length:1263 start_codon:yes stop_codon:yes gene_type:complete
VSHNAHSNGSANGSAKMPKSLSDIQVKNIKKLGNHRVAPSLYLHVKEDRKLWYIRQQIDGKRKWIYLGAYPAMTPKDARAKAAALLAGDVAPQEALRTAKQKKVVSAKKQAARGITFEELAEQYIENIKRPVWSPRGKSEQSWRNTLNKYILPVIGHKEIEDITPDDMVEILAPIWTTKNETATKTRGRVENVIDYAIARGISDKRNPAQYRNLLQNLLPAYKKKREHFAALPVDELPEFASQLWGQNNASHSALKLILLTQTRQADAREALWTDFNLQDGTWMCPINKLGGEVHKLPIPKQLLWSLQEMAEYAQDERLFPGSGKKSKFISEAAVRKALHQFDRVDALGRRITMHGFRSTFVDWTTSTGAGTVQDADRQLAHREKNQVLAAYMRTDLFERRVKLAQAYEDFALSDLSMAS